MACLAAHESGPCIRLRAIRRFSISTSASRLHMAVVVISIVKPRQPSNQTLERTADRRENFTFDDFKTEIQSRARCRQRSLSFVLVRPYEALPLISLPIFHDCSCGLGGRSLLARRTRE